MAQTEVIEAAKNGDAQAIERLLAGGASINEQDEQGWTPLNWAAGKGDAATVALLLSRGADVTLTGRDNRTPLMIAKAAGREEAARLLTEMEQQRGVWQDPRTTREFCKAHYARDLQPFFGGPGAGEGSGVPPLREIPGETVVYIHQDFTVTKSMWHAEDILFDAVTPEWKRFCEETLGFAIPDDLL